MRASRAAVLLAALLVAAALLVGWLNVRGEEPLVGDAAAFVATPGQVARMNACLAGPRSSLLEAGVPGPTPVPVP